MLVSALVAVSSSCNISLACTVTGILVTASIRRLHRAMDVTCALLASVRVFSGKVPVACEDNLYESVFDLLTRV